jgi:hypothetical protein
VAAPLLVVTLGPWDGVTVATACGCVLCLFMMWSRNSELELSKFRVLCLSATLPTIVPGTWVALVTPTRWLQLGIGLLLVVALTATLVIRPGPHADHPGMAWVGGVVTGIVSATAGISGPPITVYGRPAGWSHSFFAANIPAGLCGDRRRHAAGTLDRQGPALARGNHGLAADRLRELAGSRPDGGSGRRTHPA